MNSDEAQSLQIFLQAMGNTLSGKKPPKIAPGGVHSAKPAPMRMGGQDGLSDSAFVQQVIQAAQQLQGGSTGVLTSLQGQSPQAAPPPQMGQQQAPQQQGAAGAGGLAGLMQMMGGMRK